MIRKSLYVLGSLLFRLPLNAQATGRGGHLGSQVAVRLMFPPNHCLHLPLLTLRPQTLKPRPLPDRRGSSQGQSTAQVLETGGSAGNRTKNRPARRGREFSARVLQTKHDDVRVGSAGERGRLGRARRRRGTPAKATSELVAGRVGVIAIHAEPFHVAQFHARATHRLNMRR